MRARIFASAAAAALALGLVGCGTTPSTETETLETSDAAPQTGDTDGTEEADGAEETAPIEDGGGEFVPWFPSGDRSELPWNDEVPPEFPLEDIPLPTEGAMDYAELVEEDVWNVMISDIPEAVHEAWIEDMVAAFKVSDPESLSFMGPRTGGVWFSVDAMVFETTDTGLVMAYRIKDMGD